MQNLNIFRRNETMESASFSTIETSEYATFFIKNALCGISLDHIQEINKPYDLTVVPQAPDYVRGIINLRGKIVTVIDTGKRLGLSPIQASEKMRTIVVNDGEDSFGLMVDGISNVVTVEPDNVDAPPANIGDIPGRCFHGVSKADNRLIGLLTMQALW
jgi:purine-binding chemotaxis protein CheW